MSSPREIASEPGDDWKYLSALEVKREWYSGDQYFREAITDATEVLGAELYPTLHRVTLMIVQPEALVGRRVADLLRFLTKSRFTPVSLLPFTYTRHIGREIWRYQWNAATLEKLELADRRNCALPTAIVILRDDHSPHELPAPLRLQALKGSAIPEERDPDCLRAILRSPNRMINFVHTADEPADVIRELGICFERSERLEIFAGLASRMSDDLTETVARELGQLEDAAPRADFNPDASWSRILQRASGSARDQLESQRELFGHAQRIDWKVLIPLCAEIGADEWDILTIWTMAVEHQDNGHTPLIKFNKDALNVWRRDAETLCLA